MLTILIYSNSNPHTLSLSLDAIPHIFIPASSHTKAVYILNSITIDIVICDLEINDIELGPFLRNLTINNPGIKTILTGNLSTKGKAYRLIDEKLADTFISSPLSCGDIEKIIADITKKHPRVQKNTNGYTTDIPEESGPRYRLYDTIAEGGTSRIYRARDILLDATVAVKILPSEIFPPPLALEALRHEARIIMGLSHRHIINLHNLTRIESQYAIVMEFLRGENLHDLYRREGPLSLQTVSQIIRVCGDALAYAHRHGILHNDLKPANLFLTDDGVLKIIDFGISHIARMTNPQRNYISGTPAYMSPEQKRGEAIDAKTDIYALAIIAYELLTASLPFPKNIPHEEIITLTPSPFTGIPDPVKNILDTAISPDRKQRWSDVATFANRFIQACEQSL